MEDVDSLMRGTHEFHDNWAATKSNDSTVIYIIHSILPSRQDTTRHDHRFKDEMINLGDEKSIINLYCNGGNK